jgi:putative spermidine/putrescine transport system permease protein
MIKAAMMGRIWHCVGIALLMGALIAPLIPLAIWSLARGWRFPSLLPQEFTLAAWSRALSPSGGVLAALGTSALIAGAVTLIAMVLALPAGRALALMRFRGRGLAYAIIAAPLIVPSFAAALGLHGVFVTLGLTGSIWGVILVHLIPVLPYAIFIIAGIFATYDTAYEGQARSLGARPAQVLIYVTLPALAPALMVGALFAFLVSWSQYLLTLMIGAGRVQTLPMVLFGYASAGRNDLAGAIAMIYILPALVLMGFAARRITGQSMAQLGMR